MKIEIGESFKTPFANEAGVYQDGTVPLYRDVDGRLWGMSGHSHMGHIGMFCGTTLKDMRYVYEAKTNFEVGTAGTAFAGINFRKECWREEAYGRSACTFAPVRIDSFAIFTMKQVGTARALLTMRWDLASSRGSTPISGTSV